MRARLASTILGAIVLTAIALAVPAAGAQAGAEDDSTRALWRAVSGTPPASLDGAGAQVRPDRFRAFRLDADGIEEALESAPSESADGVRPLVLSLPAPGGGFQRFAVEESPVMEPALARRHPGIETYGGRGIDDPTATIRADVTPLGFHASIRSPRGNWYVDPYYHLDDSLYVAYYGRDLEDRHGTFVERDDGDTEELLGALAGGLSAQDVPQGPEVQLRTYRLALLTNPGYANFFGGPENVTAAKVTLVNRVTQIYEDETGIRLVLIGDNDLLNLDTPALMTEPNGPCGTAPCYTPGQSTGCSGGTLNRTRIVIGQIVGASAYDIGHIALGNPGGGVAGLRVVGGDGKARGCTGLSAPVGDFFAVDYVAHEMGHQFGGNHTFNGTVGNCSGGNRSSANSVEPGSGSSIMAYAGICGSDNLQTNTDPYWSQRSYQEITAFVTSSLPPINEVQNVALRDFDADGDSFRITFGGNASEPIVRGANYTAAGIAAAIQAIPGWPGGTVAVANFGGGGSPSDNGFQVTFSSAPLAGTNVEQLGLADFSGASGFVGETAKGGPVDNQGFTVTPTGNHAPVVTTPAGYTIPLRTPFALTASAADFDGDTVTYLWEQNDRGGTTGTALQNNVKANGPLFRVFGTPLRRPPYDPRQYYAEGENHPTSDPTRVFPDLAQIVANRTNAVAGTCPAGDVECFSEFLPTADYVGFAGVNADPARLTFRVTARDNRGGVGTADTSLFLAAGTGPFLVTAPTGEASVARGAALPVEWDVAGTDAEPISTENVRISLSIDGGLTYPHVLAAGTPNDGSAVVTVPNVSTTEARVKVEAVGNVFFDVSDADFTIHGSFVTGSGSIAAGASAGTHAADAGSRLGFALDARYQPQTAVINANVAIDFRSGGRSYRIESDTVESLRLGLVNEAGSCAGPPSSTCPARGDLRAVARLTDVTVPGSPVLVAEGLVLGLTLADRGQPGRNDSLGVTLRDGDTLVLSSDWSGSETLERPLVSGNIVVH